VAGTDDGTGLVISDPSDSFEQEAEATASRVMAASAATTPHADIHRARRGGAPGQADTGLLAVQRDVLSHVDVDKPDYWGALKGEVKSDYGLWLGQFDRTFRGFVSIMGQSAPAESSLLGSLMETWVGFIPAAGEISVISGATAKAFLKTMLLLMANASSGKRVSTLGELEKAVIGDMNALTEKVRNTDSDLPIYQEIDAATAAEHKAAPDAAAQHAARLKMRIDLANALAALPSPAKIEQDLATKWVQRLDATRAPVTIFIEATIDMRKDPLQDMGFGQPFLAGLSMQQSKNTIEALTDGFGAGHSLLDLPIKVWLRFISIKPVRYEESARIRDELGVYVKEQGSWTPTGTIRSTDLFTVATFWFQKGKKPTLADLNASDMASAHLEDLYVEP
jgi:hypothetical protein